MPVPAGPMPKTSSCSLHGARYRRPASGVRAHDRRGLRVRDLPAGAVQGRRRRSSARLGHADARLDVAGPIVASRQPLHRAVQHAARDCTAALGAPLRSPGCRGRERRCRAAARSARGAGRTRRRARRAAGCRRRRDAARFGRRSRGAGRASAARLAGTEHRAASRAQRRALHRSPVIGQVACARRLIRRPARHSDRGRRVHRPARCRPMQLTARRHAPPAARASGR